MSSRKRLVISGINLVEGGTLTVFRECISAAALHLSKDWEVVVLAHDKSLIDATGVAVLEFPLSKRSWLLRLYYEWWYFGRLAKKLKPDFWLSLHDMTPFIGSCPQAVYCHNPAPFYRITSFREVWQEPTLLMFNLFYRYLYGMGIHRNKYVIVQQDWLRREFERLFKVKNVIVSYPLTAVAQVKSTPEKPPKENFIFLYPALPRVFKNIQMLCEAVKILNLQGITGFEVRLTMDGSENRFAAYLTGQYAGTPNLAFIGRQSHRQMMEQYTDCDCVLFPSRLETWGLPISEAKSYGKPLLVAELPYAHETVGDYDKVAFVDSRSAADWAENMRCAMMGRQVFSVAHIENPHEPFVRDWQALLKLLTA